MAKDPAFLFYSNDFYAATRTMLPRERACLMDLLVYQHQNGVIPLDLERVLMFCTGVDQATLQAVLEAKFKRTEDGYINAKLSGVIEDRSEYKNRKSESGTIGAFYKKLKKACTPAEYEKARNYIKANMSNDQLIFFIKNNSNAYLLLKAMLKQKENEDEIESENKKEDKSEDVKKSESEKFETFESLVETEFLGRNILITPKHRQGIVLLCDLVHFKTKSDDPRVLFDAFFELWDGLQGDKFWGSKRNDLKYLAENFETAYSAAELKSSKIKKINYGKSKFANRRNFAGRS